MARDEEYALATLERARTDERDAAQVALATAIEASQRARDACLLARQQLEAHEAETASALRAELTGAETKSSSLSYLSDYRSARAVHRDHLVTLVIEAERVAKEAATHESARRDALIEAGRELQKIEKHRERWTAARTVAASRRDD